MDKHVASLFGKISRRAGKVIGDYGMIAEGDRIIIGVSGGKDSLTLLNVMLHRQKIAPVDFEIMVVHIDSGIPGPDLVKLEAYFQHLGVAYHIERTDTFRGKDLKDLNCFWCSWNRRKALFQFATANGFSKIALAHHLDDIVETILLNQYFKGEISAMCPRQSVFDGKCVIIRPLAYEREEMITRFANAAGLASFETCCCPVSGRTQRAAIKKILREIEKVSPAVKMNIFNSLTNIKEEYLPKS
jgi:tRNA 2-thiocytidine biosynthesis protein TtcA